MSEVIRLVRVGIAESKLVDSPDRLRTSGLGSCVGIVLYDALKKTAGMGHIMLPDSTMAKKKDLNRAKYADTAIEDLLKGLKGAGASTYRIKAKMAGGAQMFQLKPASDLMRIGPRNVDAVRRMLHQFNIPIEAEDVGGRSGRTIEFDPLTCLLHIKKVNEGEVTI